MIESLAGSIRRLVFHRPPLFTNHQLVPCFASIWNFPMQAVDYPLISFDQQESVRDAMQLLGLWEFGEVVMNTERAGEGNMNMVVRVATTRQQIILKQSRPWVEKYPQILAPAERSRAETDFYRLISEQPDVAGKMPKILAADQRRHLLAMEDLGPAGDYSDLYAMRQLVAMPIEQATAWLAKLHAISLPIEEREQVGCLDLRKLNHQHMFLIPLETPSAVALDSICEGLENLASEIRGWPDLVAKSERLGEQYLQTGEHLLHGDFYPGSWLRTEAGFRVIDPEFAFAGPSEFDLGILAAHCVLCGGDEKSADDVIESYRLAGGSSIDVDLLRSFAAIEIIRRLIGVAQLPLVAGIEPRRTMAAIAKLWL
ncbi:MAG: phosphotransferase [Rubripirellula sp.]|nr:phosphotransferase [Rubripirellula sp.]